jgi:hypothetical protein
MRKLLESLNRRIVNPSVEQGYGIGPDDYFALGYLAAKYGLENFDDVEKLNQACEEYDKTDELMLLDTIKETLIDLEILKND